jgi:transcriptional regulator with XRE-family HTH domain
MHQRDLPVGAQVAPVMLRAYGLTRQNWQPGVFIPTALGGANYAWASFGHYFFSRAYDMSAEARITGRLILAARALAGINRAHLASASGVSIEALERFEASGSAWLPTGSDAEALVQTLENFGALFIGEHDGLGAGVRLKFTRDDVKQLARLENEGGTVRDDDVP